jgi:hypothetical protein
VLRRRLASAFHRGFRRRKLETGVEFDEWNFNADFRHLQYVAVVGVEI